MPGTDSLIGKTFSHYLILERLGGGGMGVVYKAEDIRLHRFVALKFLPEEIARRTRSLARFQREAQAASALNHPNICTIYDIGEQDGRVFLAMELLEGQTLKRAIAGRPMEIAQFLKVAIEITAALEAAHEAGIIHRDVKPANIFIAANGRAKLLDFGVAKRAEHVSDASQTRDASSPPEFDLTQPGSTIGTIEYMSPEQVRGQALDARTDIFSFGAVLYEMATGQEAFGGDTSGVIYHAILAESPRPVNELNPATPLELTTIISHAMEKNRAARYASAAQLGSDLARLQRALDSGVPLSDATGSASRAPRHITESTDARGQARRRWSIAVAAALAVIALAAGAYFHFHRAPVLTEKDTIVLADFTNATGDTVFDDTLKTALSVSLRQSPFLNVLSDSEVANTLQLMARPDGTKLTPEVARELCERAHSEAYVAGSIDSLGSEYVVGLKAVNCQNGDVLAQEQVTAASKEKVLNALGGAATRLRGKLGESLATVQKFDVSLVEATTPSLEALQAYSRGRQTMVGKGGYTAAIPYYQRAIRLDPKFAMAYASLATSYNNLGQPTRAAESTSKAYELRERASERERFYIESKYYVHVTGDLEKARQTYELWAQTYPRDGVPSNNLGTIYDRLGQHDKALAEAREALRLDPDGLSYVNLVNYYLALNRQSEAQATAAEAQAKQADSPLLHSALYGLAFLQNDAAGMTRQVAWAAGQAGVEDVLLGSEADTAAYSGRLTKARELSRRAVASAERAEEKETAAGYEADAALREALFGNTAEARQRVAAVLALSTGRDVQYGAALALALAGDATRAQALADDFARRFPEDTIVQFNYLPTIHAQLALDHNDPSKAIEALQAAAPYELGAAAYSALSPVHVRGAAYLAGHHGAEAAAEFQKILDHRGQVQNEAIGALARLGLARAYALQAASAAPADADVARAKSRAAYNAFLTLWKDADPDIPILRQAKAEYAKLQ